MPFETIPTYIFDLHCDTLDRLALHKSFPEAGFAEQDAAIPDARMSSLANNDCHIALDRMAKAQYAWCQCFAAFIPDHMPSDWGWQARMASDLRREFKFSTLMPASRYHPDAPEGETMLLQGVVDCCFTGGDGLTVIDFKTDRVTPETAEKRAQFYRGQVELYSQALTALTGTPVVHKVLWFFALGRGFEV